LNEFKISEIPILAFVTDILPERTNWRRPYGARSFLNCSVSSLKPVFSITKNSGETVTIVA